MSITGQSTARPLNLRDLSSYPHNATATNQPLAHFEKTTDNYYGEFIYLILLSSYIYIEYNI